MKRKGQAAMEFLMTYGWAILAAIIAIGVLYLIIGNPSNLAGDNFQISSPFVKVAQAASTSGVIIEFKNGVGESITLSSVVISNCGTNDTAMIITDGSAQAVVVPCTLTSGDRIKGDVTISYTTSGSTVTQKATGTVNLKVA